MFIEMLYVYLTPFINIKVFTTFNELGEFYVVKIFTFKSDFFSSDPQEGGGARSPRPLLG